MLSLIQEFKVYNIMRTQQCLVLTSESDASMINTSESDASMKEEYFILKGDNSWLNYHPYLHR